MVVVLMVQMMEQMKIAKTAIMTSLLGINMQMVAAVVLADLLLVHVPLLVAVSVQTVTPPPLLNGDGVHQDTIIYATDVASCT